jgi:hypothetical protein
MRQRLYIGCGILFDLMKLSSDTTVAITSRQVGADLGEEIILLHLENGNYYGLEEVGARIWRLMEQPTKVREIERVLLEEYDIEPERCHEEVVQLLSDLIDNGLVEVTEK